jgi:hypothetical protein
MKKLFPLAIAMLIAISTQSYAQTVDLKVVQSNLAQCDTSGSTIMQITLVNNGGVPIIGGAPVLASYSVNGGAIHTESIDLAVNCNPGDTAVLSFVTPYTFDQHITYNCMYAIDYLADDTVTNDTVYFTRTFWVMPGYGNHSSDTAICDGDAAYLMMELTGNGPWLLDIVMGPDTIPGLPVMDPVLFTYMYPDSSMNFTLLNVTDSNGCTTHVGLGISIEVNYYPQVYLGTDTTLCAYDTLVLDAGNAGASYTWWNGPGGQTNIADTSDWGGALGFQYAWVDVNAEGCVTRDTLIIEWIFCPDAVNELIATETSVFPNPSDGLISIELPYEVADGKLQLMNIQGQCVLDQDFSNSSGRAQLDLHQLSRGSYFLLITDATHCLRSKVILE